MCEVVFHCLVLENYCQTQVCTSLFYLFQERRMLLFCSFSKTARSSSAVGDASDSRARGPRFDTWSGHIRLFLLLLIQQGQLSVTGKSMCAK